MPVMKLLFSALTLVFAGLGLTGVFSYDVTMPVTFVCLSVTMFITAGEYKRRNQKRSALHFLLLGIFLLIVTIYNTLSIVFGI